MRLLASASVLAACALGATPAFAAGTDAGTTVTNTVTLNYSVGGVSQTPVEDDDAFVVDRKIDLSVVDADTVTTQVVPGQTGAVVAFTVTNATNATLDFALSATQLDGGAGAHSNTDTFDASNLSVFVDSNANGVYDPGTDTATFIDELQEDQSVTVFVVGDIALNETNGEVAAVRLRATASEGGSVGVQGAVLTADADGNDAAVMENVFADENRDGYEEALDDYTVSAASLTLTKTSRVVWDPVNESSNPYMIPGAVVEYCIAISNADGAATATGVQITDPIPTDTTYDSGFGILTGVTISGGTCVEDGSPGGSFAGDEVTVNVGDVAGNTATGIRFRVTVD